MNAPRILIFLVAAFLIYTFLIPWIGVSGFLGSLAITIGILMALKVFAGQNWAFPWVVRGTWVIVVLFLGALFGGLFTFGALTDLSASMVAGEQIVQPIGEAAQETVAAGACSVSGELKGKTSTLTINAWDMESNTPYASAVDISSCYLYKNGNDADDYVTAITDTSGATQTTGFAVGNTLYLYCANDTYYADPIEGKCLDAEEVPVNIDAHTIATESNMAVTCYDDTGGSELSSGTSTQEDYYVTMGADEEASIYLKLKVNDANEAFDLCAVATAAFTNVSSIKPADSEPYSKDVTPEWLSNIAVKVNETGSITGSKDYVVYARDTALRLHEWESVKPEFIIASDSSNDPLQTNNDAADAASLAMALFVDCAWDKGGDGKMYYDFYTHDDGEGNVGLVETATSPLGKELGVVIEAR